MSYEQASQLVQIWGLLFFTALFALVLLYVFWPSNRARFRNAASIPLRDDAMKPEKASAAEREPRA